MSKKLAIQGHLTHGNEVIELLKMMGGKAPNDFYCNNPNRFYYVLNEYICWNYIGPEEIDKYEIFTLEEFLEKYPFKVGNKVFLYDNITEGCITGMKWDEDKGTVKYCVYISAECWCDVKELLKWSNVNLIERHYIDNMEEKDRAKAPVLKGEDYSGKRFGYKIPDGYEFDVVADGKIFLTPIKSKYPETYKECCGILGMTYDYPDIKMVSIDECNLYSNFIELVRCRNAYWKIAGEEMGLDKHWEPNWTTFEGMPAIFRFRYNIVCDSVKNQHCLLVFPTEEMRDAFYENFNVLINNCKELL